MGCGAFITTTMMIQMTILLFLAILAVFIITGVIIVIVAYTARGMLAEAMANPAKRGGKRPMRR